MVNIMDILKPLKNYRAKRRYNKAMKECDRFFEETTDQIEMFDKIDIYLDSNKEYRPTYKPSIRTEEEKALVKRTIDVFGIKYLIIALISGSIGYYSFPSARLVIKALYTDVCYTSERNGAVFKGDLVRELFHDVLHIRREKDYGKDSYSKNQLVKVFYNIDSMKDWNTIDHWQFSALYPSGI